MSYIYLPEINFDLKENPNYFSKLEETNISKTQYEEYIEPFLNSLSGFYHANGPQLMTYFLPRIRFEIKDASFSKILNSTF